MGLLDFIIILFGLILIVLGVIIKRKQLVSSVLEGVNSNKIKEEHRKAYTKIYGISYILMGFLTTICGLSRFLYKGIFQGPMYGIYLIGLILFMVMIIRTQIKYKTGLFS